MERVKPEMQGPPGEPSSPRPLLPEAVLFADQELLQYKGLRRSYTPDAGKAALKELGPRLAAYPDSKLAMPRLDVQRALLAGFALYAQITETPPLLARFQRQHAAGEFEIANLDLLFSAALAAFHAHVEAGYEGASATDAVVPPERVAEAREVEGRMQALCEYLFEDDPAIAPLLALHRPGTGHRDLARDLRGYGDIYDQRADLVAKDPRHYRPTDRDDAFRLAAEIQEHCSRRLLPEGATADRQFRKAWALYTEVHAEVRSVGLHLHRHDPQRDRLFPSLYAIARPVRGKGRRSPPGAPEGPGIQEAVGQGTVGVKKKPRRARVRSGH